MSATRRRAVWPGEARGSEARLNKPVACGLRKMETVSGAESGAKDQDTVPQSYEWIWAEDRGWLAGGWRGSKRLKRPLSRTLFSRHHTIRSSSSNFLAKWTPRNCGAMAAIPRNWKKSPYLGHEWYRFLDAAMRTVRPPLHTRIRSSRSRYFLSHLGESSKTPAIQTRTLLSY